jgi:hypothetical protein
MAGVCENGVRIFAAMILRPPRCDKTNSYAQEKDTEQKDNFITEQSRTRTQAQNQTTKETARNCFA